MINTDHYKKLILKELAEVEAELKTVGRKNPSNPDDWEPTPEKLDTDRADEMEVAQSLDAYEENSAILKQLEIRFNDLKDALKRIEEGTYGICERSGKPIEKERLDANPAARTCIAHLNK